ncbi:MAG: 2-succinyl-5-enolpyruvyl-6-hydroxy-3-cyclohexene-1-carboxylic-acid synthase [Bacteroidota bacterium]
MSSDWTCAAPNANHVWARLLIDELVRCGVTTFFVAPGSRSTPLTVAVAQHPEAHAIVHFDERGTSFAALGYGRATRHPAAWITTSGTALANGYPAVIEASVSGVPMLLLTADRPPELRDTGANQTIDQPGMYGGYVRWQFDMPAPSAAVPAAFVLTTVDQAVHRATQEGGGPVHLNCMFREPLAPINDGFHAEAYLKPVTGWRNHRSPFTQYSRPRVGLDASDAKALTLTVRDAQRGLVVLGELATRDEAEAAVQWAARLGWPVFTDVLSQARGLSGDTLIRHHDLVLAHQDFAGAHAPDVVVHFGRRATSKRLLQFLERMQPTYIWVKTTPDRLDPCHQTAWQVKADMASFCEQVQPAASAPTAWTTAWMEAEGRAAAQVKAHLEASQQLTEPTVAQGIAQHIDPTHGLYLAASMPVRDMELVGGAVDAALVVANRGASGIDGTVASAVGLAVGLQRPVTLLMGDLALLHDLNALALVRSSPQPITIVVINNDGGGIFSFLPIAQHEDVFEPYFGTPHGLDFAHAAAQFGLRYHRPTTTEAFTAAYCESLATGSAVIEVQTDRLENHALHQALLRLLQL